MATTASRSEPPPEGKAKGSSNPLFALLDSPVFRVTLVVITTFVPLAALFHLVFIHGASWWRLLLSVFATIVDIGTCMTVINHRFFAHRAFETGRLTQFALGWIGCLAYQEGPLWWAVKHRRHHRTCDTKDDPHSWTQLGYFQAWIGWTMDPKEGHRDDEYLGSLEKFPELWAVDRLWFVPPMALTYGLMQWGMHPAYPLMSMLACRLITLHFNCVFHPPDGQDLCEYVRGGASTVCRAIDMMRGPIDFLADIVGEAHHDDHHVVPGRAKRPGRDYAYYYFIAPMISLGLAWGPKSMAFDEVALTKRGRGRSYDYTYHYCIKPMVYLGLMAPRSAASDEAVKTKRPYDSAATGQTPASAPSADLTNGDEVNGVYTLYPASKGEADKKTE